MRQITLIPVILMTLILALPVMAQRGGGPGRGLPTKAEMQQNIDDMVKAVGLTDVQKDTILHIQQAHMDDVHAKMQAAQGKRRAMRDTLRSMQDDMDAQIIAVLTEAQVPKYQAYVEQKRSERRKNMRGRR